MEMTPVKFQLQIVENQIQKVYNDSNCSWSLQDCFDVFSYYFSEYYEIFGKIHPKMRTVTIRKILERLDTVHTRDGEGHALYANEYPEIIDLYFDQVFSPDCDYSMAHFTSGDIRLLRCYELGLI